MKRTWNFLVYVWYEIRCRLGLLRPNQTTIDAIEAAERGEVFRTKNMEELMKELHREDEDEED